MAGNGGVNLGGAYFELSVDTQALLSGLSRGERAAKESTAAIGQSIQRLDAIAANTAKLVDLQITQSLKKAEQQSKATGSAFGGMFANLTAANLASKAIGDLTGKLGDGAQASINFGREMAALQAVSGATAGQMAQLSAQATTMGKSFGVGANEAAKGLNELIKGGVSVTDSLNGAAAATLTLAKAGGVDLAQAAQITTTALNVYGLSAAQAAHVADLVAGSANASAISVSDFQQSLSQAAAISKIAGETFDSTAQAITVLGQAGLKGSDAGTSLRTFTQALIAPTSAATTELQKLGIVTADGANKFIDASGKLKSYGEVAQILQDSLKGLTQQQQAAALSIIFGADASRAAAILTEKGAAGFNAVAAAMDKISASDVAAQRVNSLGGDMDKAAAAAERLAIAIGKVVEGPGRALFQAAASSLDAAAATQERTAQVRNLASRELNIGSSSRDPDQIVNALDSQRSFNQYGGTDAEFQKRLQERFPKAFAEQQAKAFSAAQDAENEAEAKALKERQAQVLAAATETNKKLSDAQIKALQERTQAELDQAKRVADEREKTVIAGLKAEEQAYKDNADAAIKEADQARDGAISAAADRRDQIIAGLEAEHSAREAARTQEDRAIRDQQRDEDRARQASQTALLAGLEAEKQAIADHAAAAKAAITDRRDTAIKALEAQATAEKRTADTAIRAIDSAADAERKRHTAATAEIDAQAKAEDKRHRDALANIDAETKAALGPLNAQLEALDAAQRASQQAATDAQQQRALGDANTSLTNATKAGDPRGIAAAMEQVRQAQAAIEAEQAQRSRDSAREGIQSQIDAIQTQAEARRQAEQEAADARKAAIEDAKQAEAERTQAALEGLAAQKQIEQDRLAAALERIATQKDAETASSDDALKALQAETDAAIALNQQRVDAAKAAYDAESQRIADLRQAQADALADTRRAEDAAYDASKKAAEAAYDAIKKSAEATRDAAVAAAKAEQKAAEESFAAQITAAQDAHDKQITLLDDLAKQYKTWADGAVANAARVAEAIRTGSNAPLNTGGRPEEGHIPSANKPPAAAAPTATPSDRRAQLLKALADAQIALQSAIARGASPADIEAERQAVASAKTLLDNETNRVPIAREFGGPVLPGRPYLVGEKHPEIFVPTQAGTIYPTFEEAQQAHGRGLLKTGRFATSQTAATYGRLEEQVRQFQAQQAAAQAAQQAAAVKPAATGAAHPVRPGAAIAAVRANAAQPPVIEQTAIARNAGAPNPEAMADIARRGAEAQAAQQAELQRFQDSVLYKPITYHPDENGLLVPNEREIRPDAWHVDPDTGQTVPNQTWASATPVHNMLVPQPPALPQYQYPGEGTSARDQSSDGSLTFHGPFTTVGTVTSDVDMDRHTDRTMAALSDMIATLRRGGSQPRFIR